MRSLAELQQAFSDYLLSPEPEAGHALLRSVKASGLPPAGQLGVYKNNVVVRFIDALVDTYPAVERLVGKEFFRFAARTYAALHPPRSPLLLQYGDAFPDFLRTFEPAASVPYLPDVALLEKLYVEAYHAPEALALPRGAFMELLACRSDPVLTLHPSAHLMTSPYPASRIWEANRRDAPIEKLKIPGGPEHLLVIRPAATVEVRRMAPGAHAALMALANGDTVSNALSAGRHAAPEENLPENLATLAAGGTFCTLQRIQ